MYMATDMCAYAVSLIVSLTIAPASPPEAGDPGALLSLSLHKTIKHKKSHHIALTGENVQENLQTV